MSPNREAGELLRERGLRSTPQRREILAVFRGHRTEHLSADEVYAQASQALPELSRGTVYATLAEFTELGLLSTFGTPEPVRYELNSTDHAHFRCRLCLRLFDLQHGLQAPEEITDRGFTVERVHTLAEGICADCGDYEAGLAAGARAIRRPGPATDALGVPGSAALEMRSPLGPLLLAASPRGLTRIAFEEHGDAAALRAAASRRGGQAARGHLARVEAELRRYFTGETDPLSCEVDWDLLTDAGAAALRATTKIPYATLRSYSRLGLDVPARQLGLSFASNPIPIAIPCHRVTRGTELPAVFVGGPERRSWLVEHERAHSAD